MKVLITGASGFVGAALAARLIERPSTLGQTLTRLLLADLAPPRLENDDLVQAGQETLRMKPSSTV